MMIRKTVVFLVLLFGLCLRVSASGTQWLRWASGEDFLKGQGEGVAVTASGTLRAVGVWKEALSFTEPVLTAVAESEAGKLYVATGHPARVYRVSGSTAEKVADLPAEQATAMLVDSDGVLWITTMAPGLLLRLDGEKVEEKGRLGEGGFWDLVEFEGSILVAAGPPAEIFRLGEQGIERWAEVPDSFVRCLAVDGHRLLAGSSGSGLVLSFEASARVAVTADSPFTEISDLLVGPEGDVWAVALVGEPVEQRPGAAGEKGSKDSSKGTGSSSSASLDLDLPKVGGKTAVSELLRMTPEGALLEQHRFTRQVAGSLSADGDEILVGTGYEGEIWSFTRDGGARMATLDAVQAVAMSPGGKYVITQGPAALFERQSGGGEHRFRSEPRKFEIPNRFGQFRIQASSGTSEIRFRQGAGSPEKAIWLQWGPWLSGPQGESGLPPGRLVQWEVRLGEGTRLDAVNLARREINLAPVFKGIRVEDPGVIYLNSPPMSGPVISEDHPSFDGIFTTLGTPPKKSPVAAQGKKYWQIGYRTLSWKVSDPNNDPLRFSVEVESADGLVLPIRKNLKATQLAVDMRAIPDGRYRFRVSASDERMNPSDSRSVSKFSSWFEVDNTPPEIGMERVGGELRIKISDGSELLRVEVSEDGGEWKMLEAEDLLLDGSRESFVYRPRPETKILICRAFDTHHNRNAAALRKEN